MGTSRDVAIIVLLGCLSILALYMGNEEKIAAAKQTVIERDKDILRVSLTRLAMAEEFFFSVNGKYSENCSVLRMKKRLPLDVTPSCNIWSGNGNLGFTLKAAKDSTVCAWSSNEDVMNCIVTKD